MNKHAPDSHSADSVTPAGKRRTAMVVDSDPSTLSHTKAELEMLGFDVLMVETCKAATLNLETLRPDLVTTDIRLERPDAGFSLAYRVKKKDPKIPIIMFSNTSFDVGMQFDAATPAERKWLRVDALIEKPVRPEQLRREVERLT